jgi:hypothetical protein
VTGRDLRHLDLFRLTLRWNHTPRSESSAIGRCCWLHISQYGRYNDACV